MIIESDVDICYGKYLNIQRQKKIDNFFFLKIFWCRSTFSDVCCLYKIYEYVTHLSLTKFVCWLNLDETLKFTQLFSAYSLKLRLWNILKLHSFHPTLFQKHISPQLQIYLSKYICSVLSDNSLEICFRNGDIKNCSRLFSLWNF